MIPVTIQCGCGQRYAFDVEPVDGQMPETVACPACGVDGTAAANDAIAQSAASQPTNAGAPLRVALPAQPGLASTTSGRAGAGRGTRLPGQIDFTQAQHEARAKILWGDTPREVTSFLMIQGFNREDAESMVEELVRERTATIRGNGIQSIVIGVGMILLPIVTFFTFLGIGVIYVKILGITVAVGLWGVWKVISGSIKLASPKSEQGDASEE